MDSKDLIEEFERYFLDNIKNAYSRELYDFAKETPDSVVNFNNVLVLKKGQKYIRHTDFVFNKAFAKLISDLLNVKGFISKIASDRNARCVVIPKERKRIHFIAQEKLVGFPKVPWLNNKNINSNHFETYVVLIKNDNKSKDFLLKINEQNVQDNYEFIGFEEFVVNYFDKNILTQIQQAFIRIEKESKKYKWFDLSNIYTVLNKELFNQKTKQRLLEEDWFLYLIKKGFFFDEQSKTTIKNGFEQKIDILFSENDYAKSFLTSEWLYANYMHNDGLDKTYIVTGYLKALEQLLFWLIPKTANKAKINIAANGGFINIEVTSYEFYKATLGNMVYFLRDINNRKIYESTISRAALSTLTSVINEWVQKGRNGYFHKDNIEKREVIDDIRLLSISCYFLILGAIK